MKKVLLQINITANVGSVGKDAEGISRVAIQRGYESYIAYGVLHKESCAHLYQIETLFGQYVNALQARLFDNEGFAAKNPTKRLIKFIKKIQPDIVILHNLHGYYLNNKLLFDYLRETNVPVIYSLHDCWAFTGHCSYFTSVNCNKWKDCCFDCDLKKDYPKSWFFDFAKRNYKKKKYITTQLDRMAIVTVSDWLKELVEESFLSKYPVYKIYNGIRTDIFKCRPEKKELWPGKRILIACSLRWSLSDWKGLKDYIELAGKLPDDYLIVLVGHFDSKDTLDSLPTNIVNIDRTDNQIQLAEYYSRADVLMNLSYQETMGLTSPEGMACGLPCVVYNATASPELITSETGIVVEPGDINGVWEAVKTIMTKGKVHYSEACRKHVVENFDEIKQFEKYIDLYENLFC